MKKNLVFITLFTLIGYISAASIYGFSQRSNYPRPETRLQPPDHYHPQNPQTTTLRPFSSTPKYSEVTIVKEDFERLPDGGYRFYYEQSDGTSREEVAYVRDDPVLGKVLTVQGSYGYIAPNGRKIFVKYTSDERGFNPANAYRPPAHLPSNVINQQITG